MNSMNNDGTSFTQADPTIKPPPLARAYSEQVLFGIQPFDTLSGGSIAGNNNNGDFKAIPNPNPNGYKFAPTAPSRIPLRQEKDVLFMRPLDN